MAVVKEGYSLVKVAVISIEKDREFYYQAVRNDYLKIGSEYSCDLAGDKVRVRVTEMDIDPAEVLDQPWQLKELHEITEKKKEPKKIELSDGEVEEWRPIPGYEGIYEISNTGRVRSLDRRDKRGVFFRGRELKVRWDDYTQNYYVSLSRNGKHKALSIAYLIEKSFPKNAEFKREL